MLGTQKVLCSIFIGDVNQYAVLVSNARKSYGAKPVLNDFCMKVPRGCMCVLLQTCVHFLFNIPFVPFIVMACWELPVVAKPPFSVALLDVSNLIRGTFLPWAVNQVPRVAVYRVPVSGICRRKSLSSLNLRSVMRFITLDASSTWTTGSSRNAFRS